MASQLDALATQASQALQAQQLSRAEVQVRRRVHVRYEGTDAALVVPLDTVEGITRAFEAAYRRRYAFLMEGKRLMVEAVSVEAVLAGDTPREPLVPLQAERAVPRRETVRVYSDGRWHEAALVVRQDLQPGDRIDGPAIIAEQNATTVVEPRGGLKSAAPRLSLIIRAGAARLPMQLGPDTATPAASIARLRSVASARCGARVVRH
mgnify:CR=1 FL=1